MRKKKTMMNWRACLLLKEPKVDMDGIFIEQQTFEADILNFT